MLFNSFEFALFFPIVTLGYFALPHRHRWAWLLAASCVFYMAFIPAYMLVLATTIVVDYFAAMVIERSTGWERKAALWTSVVSTCAILFVFKYFNFFAATAASAASAFDLQYPARLVRIALPIGLSFHTFQSLSYVIEVYRGNHPAEKDFGIYALYVMFYPQLVAGPIERPQGLLDQFRVEHHFDYARAAGGLRLMAWGLFKKVVVADRLALIVNPAFNDPLTHVGLPLVLATFFFAFQIYCDFSGYSDIAIGAAQIMGFRLRSNFNRPYSARTVAEFWKRWHMSLSTWFRDYVYIPLGGNRRGQTLWVRNVLVTFLLSGLWHGANWTFVVWGALHGAYVIIGKYTVALRDAVWARIHEGHSRLRSVVSVTVTCVLVGIAWVFFRATNLADASFILSSSARALPRQIAGLFSGQRGLPQIAGIAPVQTIAFAVLLIGVVEIAEFYQARGDRRMMLATQPWPLRWAAYYGIAFSILLFGYFARTQFIYFQF